MIHRFVKRDRENLSTPSALCRVLEGVVVTEKSNIGTSYGQYTFRVSKKANKIQIARAVKMFFGVDVVSVNTSHIKPVRRRFRGVAGSCASWKKAIVTLGEGQVIDLEKGL